MESLFRPAKLAMAMAAAALLLVPAPVLAIDKYFRLAPTTGAAPALQMAVQYELKLALAPGSDFAAMLRDAGVDNGDASAAEKLAVVDLAEGNVGCNAKISVTRTARVGDFRLVRVLLMMADGRQMVIERRGADLAIASKTPPRKSLRLI
jgi:hypothetical protein